MLIQTLSYQALPFLLLLALSSSLSPRSTETTLKLIECGRFSQTYTLSISQSGRVLLVFLLRELILLLLLQPFGVYVSLHLIRSVVANAV